MNIEDRINLILNNIFNSQLSNNNINNIFYDDLISKLCNNIDYFNNIDNSKLMKKIANLLIPLLNKENNCIILNNINNIKICGDLHGDLFSLISFLELCDFNNDYIIFLGDYIDRGLYSLEVLFILFLLKLSIPSNVILLKGNHEYEFCGSQQDNYKLHYKQLGNYNIYEEIFYKLPLMCLINNNILILHGCFPQFDYINNFIYNINNNLNDDLIKFITWGDIILDEDYYKNYKYDYDYLEEEDEEYNFKYKLELLDDLDTHTKLYNLNINNLFEILINNNIKYFIRGHSNISKGFHIIKYNDIRQTNNFIKNNIINLNLNDDNNYLISLHSNSNFKNFNAAYISINYNLNNLLIKQLNS